MLDRNCTSGSEKIGMAGRALSGTRLTLCEEILEGE